MFAEVVLAKTSSFLNKIYHYQIPVSLNVQIGSEVIVPFGQRKETGYVIGFVEKSEIPNLKEILSLTSDQPAFSGKQIALAKWLAEYYQSFLWTALKLFLPPKGKRNPHPLTPSPNGRGGIKGGEGIELTSEQRLACDAINAADSFKVFLLYGVTGSGKTEVYLCAAENMLQMGKSAIVLVPEIGLTSQLVERFRARFGDQIALLHSGLTDKQRREAWWRIASGEARLVLGTRLALFAPVKNLGLVVLDEEYEITYKSEMSPRYHAREVALKLAELAGAAVVFGSATPSVESFFAAENGDYQKLTLPKRIADRPLPPVAIVDMRQEKDPGLSAKLAFELQEVFARGEQAILFINRRGYYTVATCSRCGKSIGSPPDIASLSKLICPVCQGTLFRFFGTGTQRIESAVLRLLPQARVLRFDRDAIAKRGKHEEIFQLFSEGKADVLIGTQLVTKGLDLASVTLVGVISADTGLSLPDFRAAEHTFQLLTQIAGRAGRHHLPGKVIIQTFSPDNYAIQAALKHDYESFYRQEIEQRREHNLPPFSRLINVIIASKNASEAERFARQLSPAAIPAIIPKMHGLWRYQILFKENKSDWPPVPRGIKLMVDVDPVSVA